VGTLEGRILPSARKFKELGAGGKKEIEEIPSIDLVVRPLPEPDANGLG
jgi:DNA recombination protein RmuC